MNRAIVNGLFGLFFNFASIALGVGVFLLIGSLVGDVERAWLIMTGLILEVTGIILFALEYIGTAHLGQSPLRWWLRRLIRTESDHVAPILLSRPLVMVLGAGTLVTGLLLQLSSSWA